MKIDLSLVRWHLKHFDTAEVGPAALLWARLHVEEALAWAARNTGEAKVRFAVTFESDEREAAVRLHALTHSNVIRARVDALRQIGIDNPEVVIDVETDGDDVYWCTVALLPPVVLEL